MMYSNRVVLTSPLVAPWLEIMNWPGTCGNDKIYVDHTSINDGAQKNSQDFMAKVGYPFW